MSRKKQNRRRRQHFQQEKQLPQQEHFQQAKQDHELEPEHLQQEQQLPQRSCLSRSCRSCWGVEFTCGLCNQSVCRAHFRPEHHQCPNVAAKDTQVLLCPCCDKHVRAAADEDPRLVLEKHLDSQECLAAQLVERKETVVGKLVCFPFSVHKLLGHSNDKAKKRLEAMTNGPYGPRDIRDAIRGTGVKLVLQFGKNDEPQLPDSLPPGDYVFGVPGHMIGVCVRDDHSVEVHDNIGGYSPAEAYCAWKLSSD